MAVLLCAFFFFFKVIGRVFLKDTSAHREFNGLKPGFSLSLLAADCMTEAPVSVGASAFFRVQRVVCPSARSVRTGLLLCVFVSVGELEHLM